VWEGETPDVFAVDHASKNGRVMNRAGGFDEYASVADLYDHVIPYRDRPDIKFFIEAAKEAGNMVDLDSNPTKLIEIVEVAKQQLITRGALTTFSIANDVAKYFAIIPAIFVTTYAVGGGSGPLESLNVMELGTPQSAILSAIIFNALVIPALVPLALHGVRYRAIGATALLRRNLLIYGLGGVIVPFIGIKLIDLVVHNLLGA